jgi:hypothetical protein
MPLHITKVAVGCDGVPALAERQAARIADGEVPIWTRYRPKRSDEVIGGSIYWIIKHRLVARQTILGFVEDAAAGKWMIRLDAALIPVRARPKRAHQGWRYLEDADVPQDFDGGEGITAMPAPLVQALTELALL